MAPAGDVMQGLFHISGFVEVDPGFSADSNMFINYFLAAPFVFIESVKMDHRFQRPGTAGTLYKTGLGPLFGIAQRQAANNLQRYFPASIIKKVKLNFKVWQNIFYPPLVWI